MITLKFGGTSMGSAQRILKSADIIIDRLNKTGQRVSVVVSAVATVSNTLQSAIDTAICGNAGADNSIQHTVGMLKTLHQNICNDIKEQLPEFDAESVMNVMNGHFDMLSKSLDAVASFGECPATVLCKIMGCGELLSSPIMCEVLLKKGVNVELLDSRDFIYTTDEQTEGIADYTRCSVAFASYKDGMTHDDKQVLLFPGFVCTWRDVVTHRDYAGLLGRNGSDYSAAIVAYGLDAKRVEFWTDVDGVYTSDPKVVKDAIIINNMSYAEAMELSFFGSKVLHPRTLSPLQQKGIEAWSLNSHNPLAHGTRICSGVFSDERKSVICGISALKKVALVSVSGVAMRGEVGMAARIFGCVTRANASMLLITQSSSEYTISFCIRSGLCDAVKAAYEKEFALEIKEKLLNKIDVKDDCAIVSIVGDGMVNERGCASKFMNALSCKDINIKAVAQGSSERCISVVIDNEQADDAVRATHEAFFNKGKVVNVLAFGAGTIGAEMLRQIKTTHKALNDEGVNVKVLAVTTIDGMLLNKNGIDLDKWTEYIKNCNTEQSDAPDGTKRSKFGSENVQAIIDFVKENRIENPVFVDCTASYDLPDRYLDILGAGISIVTPNKRANSKSMDFYHKLRQVAKANKVQFLYETNVGAGLPIIDTLQNLYKTGDKLVSFKGIMSGSLSYIFGALDEGVKFSEAVAKARELRYTEPDPRDDLKGTDVARKALIIARESGFDIELEDIKMCDVFPKDFDISGTIEEFMQKLPGVDDYFEKKVGDLHKEGKVLRMGATIEVNEDKASVVVGMMEVDKSSGLYNVFGGENAFVFFTQRYQPLPLTVKGYGAGAGVTASGVFADVLKTARK